MTKLNTKLHEMRGIARQNLIAAKEKSKEYYDIKINPQNFNIGDKVKAPIAGRYPIAGQSHAFFSKLEI